MKGISKKIDLKHVSDTAWYRQGGAGRPFYFYIAFLAGASVLGGKNIILGQKKDLHHGYLAKDVELKLGEKDIENQKNDGQYINKLINDWEGLRKQMDEYIAKSINISDFEKHDNKTLVRLYKQMSDMDFELWKAGFHIEWFDPWGDKIVTEEISRQSVEISPEDLSTLLTPNELSITSEEELDLCRIAILSKEEKTINLARHAEKYFWLNNDWSNTNFLEKKHFEQRLSDKIQEFGLDGIKERIKELTEWPLIKQKEKDGIVERYNLSQDLQNVLYFFSRMTYWRDQRKKAALIHNKTYYFFAREFAKRTGTTFDSISFIMPEEVEKTQLLFSDEFRENLLARTANCFYYVDTENNPAVLVEKDYEKLEKVLNIAFKSQFKELKGTSACNGKVIGRVKVINTSKDFSKMKAGDILVAPMTRPEFAPLMKKALAIVTDEGGLTCHAAIISRELNIPCISGTKTATKIFKDGDLVEVDADNGVIKKI